MNKNLLIGTLMMVGFALPARAELVFTNVTAVANPANIAQLNAVAYDGNNTFVAAGENSTVLVATFGTDLVWATANFPIASHSLRAIAHGGDRFAVGGVDDRTFFSTDATTWVPTPDITFPLPGGTIGTLDVQGLAFNTNGNHFTAVSSWFQISRADTSVTEWTTASVEDPDFAEHFRGVTALTNSEFAACGLKGDIRISSDSGLNWNAVDQHIIETQPDLFGIAFGGGRLMSVGSAGTVVISTDLFVSYDVSAPIDNNHVNNAVAFTGNEFIVVGDGGRIFTTTDGNANNWTSNSIRSATAVTGSLRGVSFATSGIMKGVAVVVGDSGTVILGGTLPARPISLGDTNACPDGLPVALNVDPPVVTYYHPSDTVTADWYAVPTGGLPLPNGTGTNSFFPTNTLAFGAGSSQSFTYYAEARDLRTGLVSTNRTPVSLTLYPQPVATNLTAVACSSIPFSTALQPAVSNGVVSTFIWMATPNANVSGESTNSVENGAITNRLVNVTGNPQTVVYTVTPTSTNGCQGGNFTVSVTVNPEPVATNLTAVACSSIPFSTALQPAVSNGVVSTFIWMATPNANVSGESTNSVENGAITNRLVNVTGNPQTVVYTVTPTSTNGCQGGNFTVSVTVNPEPVATNLTAVACSSIPFSTALQPAVSNGVVSTFIWMATPNANVSGESTNSVENGAITNRLVNVTGNPQTVVYTVTPTSTNGCQGGNFTVSVTVNPEPVATNLTAVACSSIPFSTALQPAVSNGVVSTFIWMATPNANVSGESTNSVENGAITNRLVNVTGNPQTVVYTVTPTSTNGCQGGNFTVSVTVNPEPAGTNAAKAICNRDAVAEALQPLIANDVTSTFSWVAAPNANVSGESTNAVGTGTITDLLTNLTANAQNVVYTVTPTSDNECAVGTNFTVTVTVNPEPTVTSVVNQAQVLCNGDQSSLITFAGNAASGFSWVKNDTNTLLGPVAGVFQIPPFTVTNSGAVPVVATITVTPYFTNSSTGGPRCEGATTNVSIIVNPTPKITSVSPQNQTTNVGSMTTTIELSGTFTAITWTNDNPDIVSLAAAGSATDLDGMYQVMTFNTFSNGTVNITFTPYYTNSIVGWPNCRGATMTATVTVVSANNIPPTFTIQSLSTNVVLEWVAYTNTALLSATNLSSPNWVGVTNSVTTNGPTNQVTIPLLGVPTEQFFRLTNAPPGP